MTDDRREPEDAGAAPPAVSEAARGMAAGRSVNWPALESSAADAASLELLRRLQSVEHIAAFHRQWADDDRQPPSPALDAGWGTLQIIEEIGRGSFGRVYRAFDPRLDREVALKILAAGAISDSPRSQAVIEEGRLLARLRHPNIVLIHGASRVGSEVGLEMELIDGRTLSDVVRAEGPLAADEAALVGRDVCRALAAVHGAGLVHCDVKAQNVIRERGGRIVLMDLGAGRLARTAFPDLVGTPLYLAPEVIAGSPPTPRSDLYSLGVLLFYLVTSSFPIDANTISDLGNAHQSGRGRRLRDVRPDLPERFIHIVERALAADPGDRFDSAGSFESELSQSLGPGEQRPTSGSSGYRWPAAALVALTVAIAATIWGAWPRPAPVRTVERFVVPLDGHLTIPSGAGSREFAMSPDGSSLVYATMDTGRLGSHLLLRRRNEVEAQVIKNTGDAGQPFFSPDGTKIGFFAGSRIMTVALTGGAPATVTHGTAGGASWGRDGIVFCRRPDLWRVAETGGEPVRLTSLDAATGDVAIRPQVLPSGDVLFTLRQHHGTSSAVAMVTRAGTMKILVSDATSAQYLPPGYLVFAAGSPPWIKVAPFDVSRQRLTGDAVPVQALRSRTHWFDVSASGAMVFPSSQDPLPDGAPKLVWIERDTGREQPIQAPVIPGTYLAYSLRLSPDARKVAFTRGSNSLIETVDQSDSGVLIIGDLDRGILGAPLLTELVHPLAWTPDGTRITYRKLDGSIAWRRIEGSGKEEILAKAPQGLACKTGAWSPDGLTLLLGCAVSSSEAEAVQEWKTVSFPTIESIGQAPGVLEPFLATPGQGAPQFSQDGRWVALALNVPGETRARVIAHSFPDAGIALPVSPAVGRRPLWRHGELFYLSPEPTVVSIRTQPTFIVGPARPLFQRFDGYDTLNAGRLTFDASPDGRRILALSKVSGQGGDYITGLTVVLNWIDEATGKIPAR